jgi:hypothetical protein
MEKTNRCYLRFLCYGNKECCLYFEPVESCVCRYDNEGNCTNKEAQKEAKSE